MDTPPRDSSVYSILDIRNPKAGAVKLTQFKTATGNASPPTPPASTEQSSADAFNDEDLADTIIESLDKPYGAKSIPTFVLYDNRGLQLFNDITFLDEYYLTSAEMSILRERAAEIVEQLEENSVIIELGAGSLRKTSIILDAIESRKLKVTYYALDLDQNELERSLGSLGSFSYVELVGLLGTFEQGIPWLSQYFKQGQKKLFLWLGSSIGNMNRRESVIFLHHIQQTCMAAGDLFVIGFDKRKDPITIKHAYDDRQGVTREFIMNGLDHVNSIVGQSLIERSKFTYDSRYQTEVGRHVAHYRALEDMQLVYRRPQGTVSIPVKSGELIHVEYSYKYSDSEMSHILSAAQLDKIKQWQSNNIEYALVLAERRPFSFMCNQVDVLQMLYPEAPKTDVLDCQTCNNDHDVEHCENLSHVSLNHGWPKSLPSLSEWLQLWRAWDLVTRTMLDHQSMLFERPIALRHPFIFYLGHIPAFLDIQLSRHAVDDEINRDSPMTKPESFATIFERGIDPDMDDPAKCNPHSEVPANDDDWPNVEAIVEYQEKVRTRLQRLLQHWESKSQHGMICGGRNERVVWMCYEHEAMHLETLLYMLIQSPNTRPPLSPYRLESIKNECLDPAPFSSIPDGQVTIGHDDPESAHDSAEFGWDNENPSREIHVTHFDIQTRPVTNGEYLKYLKQSSNATMPASWVHLAGSTEIGVRSVYGPIPMSQAMNWPVQVSQVEADGYAKFYGMRIPTEAELIRFRSYTAASMQQCKVPNIGFKTWHPSDVSNKEVHTLGDVWEWTSTIWDQYEGFVPSTLYPGYSADFFDGKHHVVIGGSWATVPRIAERVSFRNWYQAAYPYVFAGFRCCKSNTQ